MDEKKFENMRSEFSIEKNIAFEAVKEASYLCINVQKEISHEIIQKKDRSPVTVADFGSQALICKSILEHFPNDPVIAEENSDELKKEKNKRILDQVGSNLNHFYAGLSEDEICDWIDHGFSSNYSERFWTLDPIDGTKGFLRGEQYAISLALIIDGKIQISALACPNLISSDGTTGTIFIAERNQGTNEYSLNNPDFKTKIQVSNNLDSKKARFCESVESGHSSHSDSEKVAEVLEISQEPVRLDSQAKYAAVARGDAEIYLRLPTRRDYQEKIWDHAGGCLLVTEAGGKVTDISGNPLDFTLGRALKKNRGVIVTNRFLHNQVLRAIEDVGIQ